MQVSKEAKCINLCKLTINVTNSEIYPESVFSRHLSLKLIIDPKKVTIVKELLYLFNKQNYKVNCVIHHTCEWKFCASSQLCWIKTKSNQGMWRVPGPELYVCGLYSVDFLVQLCLSCFPFWSLVTERRKRRK